MKIPLLLILLCSNVASAQSTFAAATIRPSATHVQFESDGETRLLPGTLLMHDVTIATCIKWAYGLQRAQVIGPGILTSDRWDITAKADGVAPKAQMQQMMRSLLAERFGLAFHREQRELKSFALVVAKSGPKLTPAKEDEQPSHQNFARGAVAHALTMQSFADYLGDAVERPIVDKTALPGRWDFAFDFTKYLTEEPKGIDDYLLVLNEVLEGDLGLKLVPERAQVNVMVIDKVQKPTEN